jgi:predicted 3-demethylubiquinone-9 3-methyltransferase (glyoxalase superfamily)
MIIGVLALGRNLRSFGFQLLEANDIRPVALQPFAQLRRPGTNAVDIPGRDFHAGILTRRMAGMQKITPFLWFDNNAEEAAQFYTSIFKNSKILAVSRYGDAGPGRKGSVMVVKFQLEGQEFTALNGGPSFKFSEAFSFVVSCENQQEVDDYWRKLTADGGTESQCGWLKDKFGFSWQIVPIALGKLLSDKDSKRASRVMQALLQMKKIDIATLEQAAEESVAVSR